MRMPQDSVIGTPSRERQEVKQIVEVFLCLQLSINLKITVHMIGVAMKVIQLI